MKAPGPSSPGKCLLRRAAGAAGIMVSRLAAPRGVASEGRNGDESGTTRRHKRRVVEGMSPVIESVAVDHAPDKGRVHAQETLKCMIAQKLIVPLFAREHLSENRVLVIEARGILVAQAHFMFVQPDPGGLDLGLREAEMNRPRLRGPYRQNEHGHGQEAG